MRRQTEHREEQYKRPRFKKLLARLAANVRRLRAEREWTQEQCAEKCDAMPVYVLQGIEAGRSNVTAATIARLCDGFDVDVLVLFAESSKPLPPRRPGRPKKTAPEPAPTRSKR